MRSCHICRLAISPSPLLEQNRDRRYEGDQDPGRIIHPEVDSQTTRPLVGAETPHAHAIEPWRITRTWAIRRAPGAASVRPLARWPRGAVRAGCRTANSHGGLAMGAFAPRAAALSWKNGPVLDANKAPLPKCDGKTTAASRNNKRHTLGLIPLVNGFCHLARGPKSCFFADSLTGLASLFRNRYRYGRPLSACPRGRLDSGGGSCIIEAKGDGVRRITASGLMTPE